MTITDKRIIRNFMAIPKASQLVLQPGEKLHEELLIKAEVLTQLSNKLIFIEKGVPLGKDE